LEVGCSSKFKFNLTLNRWPLLSFEHRAMLVKTDSVWFLETDEVVHVFISQQFGEHIVSLLNNGTRVHMQISLGRHQTTYYNTINRTSMLFLSISFIVLMIITLAWLVFYYVQRSRYTYAKQRLSVSTVTSCESV
jgi:hypothetical protein